MACQAGYQAQQFSNFAQFICSYDAMAETVIGLFKTEVIRQRGPWTGAKEVEFATLEWVNWFNHQRLLEPVGYVPPVEAENMYYQYRTESATAA